MKFSLFFTLSSILIVSHASASLYEELCKASGPDNTRCLQLLKSDPKIVSAKNYNELSKTILQFGVKKGIAGQNYMKEVMKTNPSSAIKQCATVLYDGVVGSFKSSLGELEVDPMTANYDAKVAGDGPTTCDRALAAEKINNPKIAAINSDILLISKLAYLATDKLPQA
ncbi:hypothetical protein Lal_00035036 [Lupinus albus]|uniref:Putative pectinesterase inhibitor domain-containing protein n=1 Tax=Lupinus albus TaxID=3870 RepID=A0A6A4QX20_LUPAL|nr:putative pectinesterase inhibitor domain-containing protein [Lupinus albus]KAF1897333.1 hypothetical protein Lal_00035036 [Lupinus albus]